ncbi:hypothetical protein ACFX2F_035100 [Malus domestica]
MEVASVDMIEVQRMIDLTMKNGLKFLKFIHPYPAYVEKFEYLKVFKIPDFSIFAGKSSLSLLEHVARFNTQCGDEKISKSPSQGTIYKNPTVSYASAECKDSQYISVDAAKIVIDKPSVCKALTQINFKGAKTRSATEETTKTLKVYPFDITKADAIFDQLLLAKIIKLRPEHNIPKAEELKGKTYCKYYNSTKYTTNNCVVFRDDIQSWIDKGKLKFPE